MLLQPGTTWVWKSLVINAHSLLPVTIAICSLLGGIHESVFTLTATL